MICQILLTLVLSICEEGKYIVKPEIMRNQVIRPVLGRLQGYDTRMLSDSSVVLMDGTIAQESDYGRYTTQLGGGPALGLCGVEPRTEIWLVEDYLERRGKEELKQIVMSFLVTTEDNVSRETRHAQLETNAFYCVAVGRVLLWTKPEPLPPASDLFANGQYWKAHYNTPAGAGTAGEWVKSYKYFALEER